MANLTLAPPYYTPVQRQTTSSFFEATQDDNGVLIEIIHLSLTKAVFYPATLGLVMTSSLLLYIIFKYFRNLIHLYFSLVCYTISVLLFCLILVVSINIQLNHDVSSFCYAIMIMEMLGTMLPGYGVLLVSLARWTCVRYPLSYKSVLTLKLQSCIVAALLVIVGSLTCLPLFGVCGYEWYEDVRLETKGYCMVSKKGGQCQGFLWSMFSIGYVLPLIAVLALYCAIVRALIIHRKTESRLNKCGGQKKKKKRIDYNYKPATMVEKLRHLRDIGADAIPWSIIVILILNTLSALAFIPQLVAPEVYYTGKMAQYVILDMAYTVMLLALAVSPASYIFSTPNMRAILVRAVKNSTSAAISFSNLSTKTTDIKSEPV